MERLVILPFSFGCISEASVAVGTPHPRKPRSETNSPNASIKVPKSEKDILESYSFRSCDVTSKPNISPSFNKLFKGFKNFPQLFVDKEEVLEGVELDMEIGYPTDVQHVTHIGWDGIAGKTTETSSDPIRGWEDLIPPHSHSSLP